MPGNETMNAETKLKEKKMQKIEQSLHEIEMERDVQMMPVEREELDRRSLSSLREGARQLERLGITRRGGGESEKFDLQLMREIEIPRMESDVEKVERGKKKEREQEKDAWKRAEMNGKQCVVPNSAEVSETLSAHQQNLEERNAAALQNWKSIKLNFTGNELTPDPDTGKVDMAGLLEQRRLLAIFLQGYHKEVGEGRPMPFGAEFLMAGNEAMLKAVDDLIQTWCAAGGIDMQTGKKAGAIRSSGARKHLALAIERYQEVMETHKAVIAEKYVEYIDQTEDYKNRFKSDKRTVKAGRAAGGLNYMLTRASEEISSIRTWIKDNPDVYLQNKKMVDQIYREYLVNSEQATKLHLQWTARDSKLRSLGAENKGAIERIANDITSEYLKHMQEDASMYSKHGFRCLDALRFLLLGKEPASPISAIYLEQVWGIRTKTRLEMNEAEKELDQTDKMNAKRKKESLVLKRREFNAAAGLQKKDTAASIRTLRSQVKRDPGNEVLRKQLSILEETQKKSSPFDRSIDAVKAEEDNIIRNQVAMSVLNTTWVSVNGKEYVYPSGQAYRDASLALMPLGQASRIGVTELMASMDQYKILEKGVQVDGTPATEYEIVSAFLEEAEVQANAHEDMKAYVQNHIDTFERPEATVADRLLTVQDLQRMHLKSQSVAHRCRTLVSHRLFATLPEEQQQILQDMHDYVRAVMYYARDVMTLVSEYAKGNDEPEAEATLVADPLTLSNTLKWYKAGMPRK